MKKIHIVKSIYFCENMMTVTVDDTTYEIDLNEVSRKLIKTNEDTRNNFKISPSGYGIYWPEIDEDLSVDGLIKIAKYKKEVVNHTGVKTI